MTRAETESYPSVYEMCEGGICESEVCEGEVCELRDGSSSVDHRNILVGLGWKEVPRYPLLLRRFAVAGVRRGTGWILFIP
jgi:hypothetical protein